MPFSHLTLIRLAWFILFGVAARREHALTGKNVFAAVLAGPCAAWGGAHLADLLRYQGLADWAYFSGPSQDILVECLYILCFLGLFALLRRLFKRRGYGRDFWLVVAVMAPLFWVMFLTSFCIVAIFQPIDM